MPERPLVCDTTVLLYLDRIGQSHLLRALFEPICVPDPVRLELDMGRLLRPDTVDPSRLGWISMVLVGQDEINVIKLVKRFVGHGEAFALGGFVPWILAAWTDRFDCAEHDLPQARQDIRNRCAAEQQHDSILHLG